MKRVHFIGCGGVGMAGIAHIAADLGIEVTGSDIADSKMLHALEARGIEIFHGHRENLPSGVDLVVYSSAVPEDDPERMAARNTGIEQCCRGAFLAKLAEKFEFVAAIGGSHGKTTTTAMTAHILQKVGLNPGYMVGGNVNGWKRNAGAGNGRILITEADESDGTQALLKTTVSAILNIDDDHFWSLGGKDKLAECFHTFAQRSKQDLVYQDDTKSREILADLPQVELLPENMEVALPIPGDFNRRNAVVAVRIAEILGVRREDAISALADFPGVERRMSQLFVTEDGMGRLIEDYAHHPTELGALLRTVHQEYPEADIWAYFQPHRFERLEYFGERFAGLLSKYCTRSIVVTPFAAWHENAKGVTAEMLVAEINRLHPASAELRPCDAAEIAADIRSGLSNLERPVVALIIGAGDIGAVRKFFV